MFGISGESLTMRIRQKTFSCLLQQVKLIVEFVVDIIWHVSDLIEQFSTPVGQAVKLSVATLN